MNLIDTHAHLYAEAFDEDRDEMLNRARAEGVSAFLLPNIDLASLEGMMDLVKNNADCYSMIGLHPCHVEANYKEVLAVLKAKLDEGSHVAVGEIGIDLYWDKTYLKEQQEALKIQLEWAKDYDLPYVIHARDSFDEIFEVMDEVNDDRLRGVFHCFTGDESQAQRIIDYGDTYLGLGGVLSFKKTHLREVLPSIPRERLLLETDSPYLAPSPHRGKRNESAYVKIVAQVMADALEEPLEKIADLTTANAKRLFRIA
ncbi:MAG: TatD family hydrolase [Bacteroidetes bacterium]|jgi:TatD DNase family protein|nr:TatD family hydrolase [Bacteroidota bacterium]